MNTFLSSVGLLRTFRVVVGASLIIISLVSSTPAQTYQLPQVQKPSTFRGAEENTVAGQSSIGDLKWFEVFKDPELQKLVRTAMIQNYDLRSAVVRINAAR